MRLRELSIILSKVKPPANPQIRLEAYSLDSESAAKIIFTAENIHHDLSKSNVADLGCGSGILSIGASIVGSDNVTAVDLDTKAIASAVDNSKVLGAKVDFVVGDIECLRGPFDVALTNPPFGTRNRGTDIRFLKKAISIAEKVYSIHKHTMMSREFISEKCAENGGRVDRIYEIDILLKPSYIFHRKRSYGVKADMYRVLRADSAEYI